MEITLQSVSIRVMILCFLIILLYSVWINYAKPFLTEERSKQDQELKKLKECNDTLNEKIIQQQQENTKKKNLLLNTKELFLLWHERRLKAAQTAEQSAALEMQNYLEKTERKQQHILHLQQKNLELQSIVNQVYHNAQRAYQGNAGATRLKKILENLESKVS